MPAERKYPHRVNLDGSWDSICARCFLTVAHCETESELAASEQKHVCDPTFLAGRRSFSKSDSEQKAS